MSTTDTSVRAVNLLTGRWARELDADANAVISGAGAWSLLSTLLAAASGEAQAELEGATSVDQISATSSVLVLLERLDSLEGVSGAIGLWVHEDVPLDEELVAEMERITIAPLPFDLGDLDRWASDRTGGLIEEFPGEIAEQTLLVVASALALDADWVSPFEVAGGQWRGEGEELGWLRRKGRDLDAASLLRSGHLTVGRVICPTVAGFDVHLVSGAPTDAPGDVLGVAIEALSGDTEQVLGSELRLGESGGCVSVQRMNVFEPGPQLSLSLPAFQVTSTHDLLAHPGLFGLAAAMDPTKGHFPRLSSTPLYVARAMQSAMAGFSATGFKAATVTMAEMFLVGLPRETASVVVAEFDRPFGFLVVDHASGLVLVAGWVAKPEQDLVPRDDADSPW